ncbi:hypothetical protein NL676_013490, partial [Syzygium grande]
MWGSTRGSVQLRWLIIGAEGIGDLVDRQGSARSSESADRSRGEGCYGADKLQFEPTKQQPIVFGSSAMVQGAAAGCWPRCGGVVKNSNVVHVTWGRATGIAACVAVKISKAGTS